MNFRDTSSSEYLNIGGTIYVFGTMIISLYLCFYTSLSRGIKFLILPTLIIYIVLSTKFTVLLLLVIFFLYRYLILIPFAVTALVLIYFNIDLFPTYFSSRFLGIIDLFISGNVSDELSRIDLASLSLKTFSENFVFGVGGDYINFAGDFDLVEESGIGHHSSFFDFLARYGLVGLGFLLIISYLFYRAFTINVNFLHLLIFFWLVANNGITALIALVFCIISLRIM